MVAVDIRKQGGAAVITIPSSILSTLNLKVGETLELQVQDHALLARPALKTKRKRYTIAELLRGADEESVRALNAETEWAREGAPVGRELL